jgi:glycosyltransferase involved in cell wall biosynthesis
MQTTPLQTALANPREKPRRVIYLVTEDWYFISHRLPMARAARDAGFEVHVATRVDRHAAAITAEGFHLHPVTWRRGSLDPREFTRTVRAVHKLYCELKPDLAHHVSLQAALVGSLAASGLPIVRLNAITGLGTVFVDTTAKARIARPALALLMRALLGNSQVLVQNPDDAATLTRLGVKRGRIALIAGSGIDTDAFRPLPEPEGPVTVAFAGRLIEGKGIRILVAAHGMARRRGHAIRLLIAGTPDPANASSILPEEIAGWAEQPGLDYRGYVDDIKTVWAAAHIAALPSLGGEGVPLSLLEAAACGRAIVATDVPGCRDIARHDVNALLVPPGDAERLADAILMLANDAQRRNMFAQAGRALVEENFSSARVGRDIVALYRHLLSSKEAPP